jgi:hypothetical protein
MKLFAAAHESAYGPSRHFAAERRRGRFRREADINRQARPISTVANDPKRTQCLCATLVLRGVSVAGA